MSEVPSKIAPVDHPLFSLAHGHQHKTPQTLTHHLDRIPGLDYRIVFKNQLCRPQDIEGLIWLQEASILPLPDRASRSQHQLGVTGPEYRGEDKSCSQLSQPLLNAHSMPDTRWELAISSLSCASRKLSTWILLSLLSKRTLWCAEKHFAQCLAAHSSSSFVLEISGHLGHLLEYNR